MNYDREFHIGLHMRVQDMRKAVISSAKVSMDWGKEPWNEIICIGILDAVLVVSKAVIEATNAQQQSPANTDRLHSDQPRRPPEERD